MFCEKLSSEELIRIFENLPERVQERMRSDKSHQVLISIFEQKKLDDEKRKILISIVSDVFHGFIKPEEVYAYLVEQGFSPELSKDIYVILYRELFKDIKLDLEKAYLRNKIFSKNKRTIKQEKIKIQDPYKEPIE